MNAVIGMILTIGGLVFALWFGLRDIGTRLERHLTLFRTESRTDAVINGYATLRMMDRVVNKGKNCSWEEYVAEIKRIRENIAEALED